ncbi:Ig-like domain-containing protein [Myxococcaceae bacterium GXIMD 01537]
MKRIYAPLMTAALVVLAAGCKKVETVDVKPATSTLTEAGQTASLQARGLTKDGEAVEKAQFTFASSDPAVATVDANGVVSAVKSGSATITAKTEEKSGAASIEVVIPSAIVIEGGPVTLTGLGTKAELKGQVQDDASRPVADAKVEYTSADAQIVEVKDNTLVAKAVGSTTVKATSGKLEQTVQVTVKLPDVAELAFDTVPATLKVGESAPLVVVAKAADGAAIQGVTFAFTTSDEKVATVDASGKVTAVKAGAVTITAAGGSKSAETQLTIGKKK